MASQLLVTLEGIQVSVSGVSLEWLVKELDVDETLKSVSDALSSAARLLSGDRAERGQPLQWTHSPTGLQLRPSGPGCLLAQWAFESSSNRASGSESYESRAIDILLEQGCRRVSSCPQTIADSLRELAESLPEGIFLWLGDAENPNRIGISPAEDPDVGLPLHENFAAELQASLRIVTAGGETRSAESVAQRQGLSW